MSSNVEFLKYEPFMHKFCNRYHVRDKEDFMQNLFIATIRGLKKFNKKANTNILTYLNKIYLNELNIHIKTNRLIRIPICRTENDIFYEEITPKYETRGVRGDMVTCNRITLKRKLNKDELKLANLYLEGYSYREIGEILNMSHENVRLKINKITKKLEGEWIEL